MDPSCLDYARPMLDLGYAVTNEAVSHGHKNLHPLFIGNLETH